MLRWSLWTWGGADVWSLRSTMGMPMLSTVQLRRARDGRRCRRHPMTSATAEPCRPGTRPCSR